MTALGADEIDMVLDVGAAKDGNWDAVEADIKAVRAACPGKVLKVIASFSVGFMGCGDLGSPLRASVQRANDHCLQNS